METRPHNFTAEQVAAVTGVPPQAARSWIENGWIETIDVEAGTIRLNHHEVDRKKASRS